MEDIQKIRALIQEMIKQVLEEAPFGHEDSYDLPDFDQEEDQDQEEDAPVDLEDDLMDEPKQSFKSMPSNEGKAASEILGNNDPNFIASAIASAEYKLSSALSDELYKIKKSNAKKFADITDALISMYQTGNKARQIQNFFANYFLISGKKFDNSNIRVLLRSFPGVDVETIEDSLTDSFMTLLSRYKATGATFDGLVHRVASNAIKKILTTTNKTTSLDAPISSKGSKTKGDMLGGEDDDMTGDSEADNTDAFGSDNSGEETPDDQKSDDSKIENLIQGTEKQIKDMFESLKQKAAEKPHKWQRILNAFTSMYSKGSAWSNGLADTTNWEKFGVAGAGKRNLLDDFIVPLLGNNQLSEDKEPRITGTGEVDKRSVNKTDFKPKIGMRTGRVWDIFDLGPYESIIGIKNPEAFEALRSEVVSKGGENYNKIMNYLKDSTPFNLNDLGDPAKARTIIDNLKAPIQHQIRELGKKVGIKIIEPTSDVRKAGRKTDAVSQKIADKLRQAIPHEYDHKKEPIQEEKVENFDSLTPEDMDDFAITYKKISSELNETYNTMSKLLNGNKLTK